MIAVTVIVDTNVAFPFDWTAVYSRRKKMHTLKLVTDGAGPPNNLGVYIEYSKQLMAVPV